MQKIKATRYHCFAVTQPGLEQISTRELQQILPTKNAEIQPQPGGISFKADPDGIYLSNLCLRTASRILIKLGDFKAAQFSQFVRRVSQLPWQKYISPDRLIDVQVSSWKSRLYHSKAIAQRTVSAINRQVPVTLLTSNTDEAFPAQTIFIRLQRDHCTVSIDSSGAHLHKRGYRQVITPAPLRETLAAALILHSGWCGENDLIDPFCGSGTIPIEAAMIAAGIAPGKNRRFSFMDWPFFDQKRWDVLLEKNERNETRPAVSISASDHSEQALSAACQNAQRAGVKALIRFTLQTASAIRPASEHGTIITNMPYGQRLGNPRKLRNLYAHFGKQIRKDFAGWQLWYLSGSFDLAQRCSQAAKLALTLDNGGLKALYFQGQ